MPGPAGRKAIPDNIKILKGTDQKCRMRKPEVRHAPCEIQRLDWLPDGAVAYLDGIRAELGTVGLNSSTYSIIANLAARRMCEIHRYDAIVDLEGDMVEGKRHPLIPAINEAQRHLQSLCSELGLTATAIGRIGRKVEPEKVQGFGGL